MGREIFAVFTLPMLILMVLWRLSLLVTFGISQELMVLLELGT